MFSIVIPTYTANFDLEEMAYKCAMSYKDHCDELIICEDGQMFSQKLKDVCTTYIYNHNNVGFTKNVNRGWRYAQGDYVAIASSDTYLVSGDPRDLCVPNKATSPIIENQSIPNLAGPFFVTPKSITEKLGYLKEELRTYYSDTEYDERVKDCFQKVESVVIHHHQAQSVTVAGVEGGDEVIRDRASYESLSKL